jgi:hypothetical protein
MAEGVTNRTHRSQLAILADALTTSRFVLALLIAAWLGVADALTAVAFILSAAWITDYADGTLARKSGGGTVMGAWDPIADATVGLGLIVGLAIDGRIGALPWLVVAAVLMAAFLVTRNLSIGMVLQAVAYGLLIVELALDAPGALWVLGATAAVIGIADGRRFTDVVLPTFFGGLGLSRRRPPPGD